MDNWVSFRGVKTSSIGVYIADMPAHKKAAQRCTEYEIPGRDGAVTIFDGYSPFDMPLTLVMLSATADMRQKINAWADGAGELITSDQPGLFWQASVQEEVTFSRHEYGGKFFDTAEVVFRCQPIMRQTQETAQVFTASGTIHNNGNVIAFPLIVITGTGDVSCTIAGSALSFTGLTKPVTIDCETGYVYTADGAAVMSGAIPSLPLGDSQIDIGTATKIEITPHWGWL